MAFRIAPPILDLRKPPKPIRCKAHLDYIRALPCLLCTNQKHPTEAAHVNFSDSAAGKFNIKGVKAGDKWTVPLCSQCHRGRNGQHSHGERKFWADRDIDILALCDDLWRVSGDIPKGKELIMKARGN